MKKSLLVMPALLVLLASCGTGGASSSSVVPSSSSTTSTPTSSAPGPSSMDITITVAVSGISAYEGKHSYIWINTSLSTENVSGDWGTSRLTQSEGNDNVWSIVFEGVEADQSYSYNTYYGGEEFSSIQWTSGINEEGSSDAPRSLLVIDGIDEYEIDSTFVIPSVTVDVTLSLTISIIESDGADPSEVLDTTYLWAWTNITGNTELFVKQDDGTWTFDFTDAPVGTKALQVTPTLGTADAANWDYQCGAWENGAWVNWGNGDSYDVAEDSLVIDGAFTFKGQPAIA